LPGSSPGGGEADFIGQALAQVSAAIGIGGAVLSVVHGLVLFCFFWGIAQLALALLDAEEQIGMQQTLLQSLLSRNSGR